MRMDATMSRYTPTTEQVKAAAVEWFDWQMDDASEAFDRWLAAEKAEAWEEGVRDERFTFDYAVGRQAEPENPYRRNEGENE